MRLVEDMSAVVGIQVVVDCTLVEGKLPEAVVRDKVAVYLPCFFALTANVSTCFAGKLF